MFLLLDTLFGLPGHALIVHAAVVLVPLAVIALAATGWRKAWRTTYSLPVLFLASGGTLFAILAASTGEPLQGSVKRAAESAGAGEVRFGEHPENGNNAEFMAIVFAVTVVAYWVVDRYGERLKLPGWMGTGSYALALVPGVLALITMVVAGHSGAALVWKDVGSYAAGK